jgi:hypothetical protein
MQASAAERERIKPPAVEVGGFRYEGVTNVFR